jgi:hypothetical protein
MSFVLGAAALSKLVLTTDCSDTNLEELLELSAAKSEHEIPIGLRWFYCAGLGLALLCMGTFSSPLCPISTNNGTGIISLCHVHKDGPAGVRLLKRYRLANRFLVCIIFFCLPTAHSLNSLQLISVASGLITWVLLLELWGISCPNESFFGEKRQCGYVAKCKISKRELVSAVKNGTVVNVSSLAEKGEKGHYELS